MRLKEYIKSLLEDVNFGDIIVAEVRMDDKLEVVDDGAQIIKLTLIKRQ